MRSIEDRPAEPAADPRDSARRTLALRIAQRNRLRELRAERLARLRPPALPAPGAEFAGPAPEPAAAGEDAAAALEEFLRALTGGPETPAAAPPAAPAAVLSFPRGERAEPACDLRRLPGAGPGLVAALRRAGLDRLAALAPLAPEELALRLGPIGRLVPAAAWIAAARAATDPAPAA
jgi:predicted flap endonuclease-1-like 5' DNA nuclease